MGVAMGLLSRVGKVLTGVLILAVGGAITANLPVEPGAYWPQIIVALVFAPWGLALIGDGVGRSFNSSGAKE